jgi:predicted ATPase/DNA-binding SARP family transcriptional activator
MPHLNIALLGTPHVTIDEVPVKFTTSRAIPLLAYLALTESVQSREVLAGLFWPDSTQKQALAALRTTLWRVKSSGLEDWITLDRNEISLNTHRNIEVDVLKFKSALNRCNTHGHPASHVCLYCTASLTEATELYHGEFMAGCNLSNTQGFDDWCTQQRETLEMLHLDALERLVKCHRTFGDFNLAIHCARIWLSYDRLNENAQFQLLQLYAITGQRTAGISLYKHYKELLWRELDIEPNEDITALYRQIVTGRATPVEGKKETAPVFMIIDIEKAAVYWTHAADKKAEILSTYSNIIKETAKHFGGLIIQKSEDNITLLFENGKPLHCAVTIHLKLKKVDWEALAPPSIRMVLYAASIDGEVPVNFALLTRSASTLLSISWGGQIIFTERTLKLLDIPSGSSIKDLGFHFLSESDGSVHLYELLHPHLPNVEHPPLQSVTHQMVNFPILTPPFIGREQELDELTNLLATPGERIISLIGPGGVGKTRLAIQACSQVVKFFPDGIYFIPLSSIQDPDYLPIILADVLKFSYFGTADYFDQLGNYLHRMKALLVIDNFEQLRVEGAKFLAFLLSKTHYLKILITSRERLNMIAETVMEIQGLPVPDLTQVDNAEMYSSTKLFVQNAQKTLSRFSYSSNREAIIEICQLVDGIPLAILLASTWVRVFSCSEIASEIKQNIDFLSTTASDIDPRHRSLIAVFDNSWELLSEEECHTLSLLSIFQAAFTSKAAQEICNASSRLLSSFTDKSLLFHRRDDRFEMLGTFHQYASSKLVEDKDQALVTRLRFCEYYAEFCASRQAVLVSSQQRVALDEIITELENIRIAWAWIIEYNRWDLVEKMKEPLFTYHVIIGNYVQGAEFINLALQKLNAINSPELVLIKTSMQQLSAWIAFRRGYIQEGAQGLTTCLEIFRSQNDVWNIALTLSYLADIQRNLGNNQQAQSLVEEALDLLVSITTPAANHISTVIAYCHSLLGRILMSMGDFNKARYYFQTSLAAHERRGTSYGTIHPLIGLAHLTYYEGDFLQSRDFYLQALEIANNIYDSYDMIRIHNNLGATFEQVVNIPDALQHVLTALKMCRETGDRRLTAVILNNLAYIQLRFLNQPSEAIRTYHESIELFYTTGDLRGLTFTYYDISKAYIKVKLLDEAWNYCVKSLNTAMTLDSTPLILHSIHGFANLFAQANFPERALGFCYLIELNSQVESDTKNRTIVTRVELETTVNIDIVQSASRWAQSANIQEVINQLLTEKFHPMINYS